MCVLIASVIAILVFSFRILLQACPLYIAEIAPKERRGTMVAMVVSFSITAVVVSLSCLLQLD